MACGVPPRQGTGLALPGADCDICVLVGSAMSLATPGSGYSEEARETIASLLVRVSADLGPAAIITPLACAHADVSILQNVSVNSQSGRFESPSVRSHAGKACTAVAHAVLHTTVQGVVGLQEELLDALVAAHPAVLQGAARIIPARVPIIKCTLTAGAARSSGHAARVRLLCWHAHQVHRCTPGTRGAM